MRQLHDLTGRRFGRITVLGRSTEPRIDHRRATRWSCRCDCGTVFSTYADALQSGRVQSCGCLRDETNRDHAAAAHEACRVPVFVTAPDGTRRTFDSHRDAAAWLGCCPATITKSIRTGKPFNGNLIIELKNKE